MAHLRLQDAIVLVRRRLRDMVSPEEVMLSQLFAGRVNPKG